MSPALRRFEPGERIAIREVLRRRVWTSRPVRIAPTGQPFEVFAPVTPELGVTSWYVNFQQPLVRTLQGFDTMDETLDLLVAADFSSWERKDGDELQLALEMGVYDQPETQRILDSCVAVENALERGEILWDRSWRDWRPHVD